MKTPAIGRNDSCPCGSGKKFKHSCLGKENGTATSQGAAGISKVLRKALEGQQFNSLEEAQAFLDQYTQLYSHSVSSDYEIFKSQKKCLPVPDIAGHSHSIVAGGLELTS